MEEKPKPSKRKRPAPAGEMADRGQYPPPKGKIKTPKEQMRSPSTAKFFSGEKEWLLTKEGKLPTMAQLDEALLALKPSLKRVGENPDNQVGVIWHVMLFFARKGRLPLIGKSGGMHPAHHQNCPQLLAESARDTRPENQPDALDIIIYMSVENAVQMGLYFSGSCTHCNSLLKGWVKDMGLRKLLKEGEQKEEDIEDEDIIKAGKQILLGKGVQLDDLEKLFEKKKRAKKVKK